MVVAGWIVANVMLIPNTSKAPPDKRDMLAMSIQLTIAEAAPVIAIARIIDWCSQQQPCLATVESLAICKCWLFTGKSSNMSRWSQSIMSQVETGCGPIIKTR
jgi:hypothetical protein